MKYFQLTATDNQVVLSARGFNITYPTQTQALGAIRALCVKNGWAAKVQVNTDDAVRVIEITPKGNTQTPQKPVIPAKQVKPDKPVKTVKPAGVVTRRISLSIAALTCLTMAGVGLYYLLPTGTSSPNSASNEAVRTPEQAISLEALRLKAIARAESAYQELTQVPNTPDTPDTPPINTANAGNAGNAGSGGEVSQPVTAPSPQPPPPPAPKPKAQPKPAPKPAPKAQPQPAPKPGPRPAPRAVQAVQGGITGFSTRVKTDGSRGLTVTVSARGAGSGTVRVNVAGVVKSLSVRGGAASSVKFSSLPLGDVSWSVSGFGLSQNGKVIVN